MPISKNEFLKNNRLKMSAIFAGRLSLPNPVDDTRHRLSIVISSDEDWVAEYNRMRSLGHDEALSMPDGLGRTPVLLRTNYLESRGRISRDTGEV